MRILVEAMCAEFGGIRTYVENLLEVWPSEHPEDDLHVLVGSEATLPTPAAVTRHEVAVRRPATLGRPLAQSMHVSRLVRRLEPDVVLATLPSTTVLKPRVPVAVVVYDLRHELRPEQFSRSRRALRRVSYGRGYALADGIISISRRSLDDLHRLHPATRRTPSAVAHLGADHVDRWERPAEPASPGHAVTFAHHSNKNLDLVLDGWQAVVAKASAAGELPVLMLLGLGSARRAEVAAELERRGLTEAVVPAPFLPEADFRTTLASARLVLFPSDFEGFGLPVAEGMRLGIPVVIGPEPATTEVAGGHATVMTDWTPEALADSVLSALSRPEQELRQAREYADRYTWAATVSETRSMLAGLHAARSATAASRP